jgi:hypothetical protein
MVLTRETIETFLTGYLRKRAALSRAHPGAAAALKAYLEQVHTADFLYVRPSGNVMDTAALVGMLSNPALTDYTDELAQIMSLKILDASRTAVVTFLHPIWPTSTRVHRTRIGRRIRPS